ncbi:MAG: TylF/MycF/NovP-related O-methyltransferase [Rhodospirillaceae bacterium]
MPYLIKKLILSFARRLGYEILPIKTFCSPGSSLAAPLNNGDLEQQYQSVVAALNLSQTMRKIHIQDAVEIEELYRKFVFANLPQCEDRAGLLSDLIGTTISEAIYIIHSLHEGLKVAGDICEFGVAQGATSRLMAAEIMPTDRKLWLFDSYEGLPAPSPEDNLINDIFNLGSMARYRGTMASPETEVLTKLVQVKFPADRIKIKKGWINESLKTADLPKQVAFAYVDFDFYEPIKDALQFVNNVMPAGGYIVVDDYGFFSEGAQIAVDEFVKAQGERYRIEMPLPFAGHFCIIQKLL